MNKFRKYKWALFFSSYVLLFGFLALFDEPLNPEARSILTVSSKAIPDAENGYYSIVGFTATPGSDIHAKGIEIVRAFESAFQRNPALEEFDQKPLLGPELLVSGEVPEIYKDPKFSCLDYAKKAKKTIDKMFAENRELLDRCHLLYRYQQIEAAGAPALAAPFPHYAPIRKVHTLVLLGLAGEANSGRISSALHGLKQDTEYWRRILKGSNDLITKLVAGFIVKENYLFFSELMSRRKIGPTGITAVNSLMQPLTREETNMSEAMRREFQFQTNAIRRIKRSLLKHESNKKGPDWKVQVLLWPFFKVNASINIISPSYKKLIDAAGVPAPEFVTASNQWEQTKKMKFGIDMLYNWAGAAFHEPIGDRENLKYVKYVARIHDLDGLLRLVSIQFVAYRDKIPIKKMQEFLRNINPRYTNPYTGEPMKWDMEKKCLYFESVSLENQKPKRIEIFL